jgi:hypothetical protein
MRSATTRTLAAAVLALVGLAGAALPVDARATTLSVDVACARYVPGLPETLRIPVSGSGFTPNTDPSFNAVALQYPDGEFAGAFPLAPDGSFAGEALIPSEFIRARAHVGTYTLTAMDRVTPGVAASAPLTIVRAEATVRPRKLRRDLGRRVRWSVYGVPTGATMYLHWTYRGRHQATRRLGRAANPCGIVERRAPYLPVTPRNGTWKVYLSPGRTLVRRQALFSFDLNVFTVFR